MKHYTLVQLFEICQARWRSAEVGRPLFFARTDQTKPLPEPTFSDPTGRPGLTNEISKYSSNFMLAEIENMHYLINLLKCKNQHQHLELESD